MPTAKYSFYRNDRTASGISSTHRPSTDAASVLSHWAGAANGRSYEVIAEDDSSLTAILSWPDDAANARSDLDGYCDNFGIERKAASG